MNNSRSTTPAMARTLFGIAALLVAGLMIASCASTGLSSGDEAVSALASLMTGKFETAPDDPKDNFSDQRSQITTPSLDGTWLYYQLNTGPERKLYRQRVIRLSSPDNGATVVQETFGLKEPERFVDLWDNPGLAASVSNDDFDPYFETGCEQVWTRTGENAWTGYVDPKSCMIFSERRQANIAIEAEAQLDAQNYRQTERGYDATGNQLFGGKPGEFITLFRQP